MRQNVITFIEEYGTNNIFAFHLSTGPQFGRRPREEWLRKPLTVDDALAIRETCPSVQETSWEGFPWNTRVRIQYRGNVLHSFNFKGVPANYVSVTSVPLADGRFFTEVEDEHRMKVCVLGADARETGSQIVAAKFLDHDPSRLARELKARRVVVAARHGFLRVSPHFYNNEEDLDRLEEGIRALV